MCSFSGATCTSRDVTMQITFLTRKSALIYRRDLRQRVASLTLNCNGVLAIRAYGNMSYVHSGSVLFQKQRVLCAEHAQTKSAPKPLQNTLHGKGA